MLIKKVLTLTDGSELSRSALPYAVEICRQFNAELYLLAVMDKVPSYLDAEINHEIIERMEDILKNEVANCFGYCETAGLECKSEVRTGMAYEEIIKYTKEIDADLIVMATHGHSGISSILLGSIAEKVVRHAPCPVLTVKPTAKNWETSKPGSCEV